MQSHTNQLPLDIRLRATADQWRDALKAAVEQYPFDSRRREFFEHGLAQAERYERDARREAA